MSFLPLRHSPFLHASLVQRPGAVFGPVFFGSMPLQAISVAKKATHSSNQNAFR
jgi:hypothetical protein